ASLADGESTIRNPLVSLDTKAAVEVYRAFGAIVGTHGCAPSHWTVKGTSGRPHLPAGVVDTANSGTTFNIALGTAALIEGTTILTGDEQTRSRPVGPLIHSLRDLGAEVFSPAGTDLPPITVKGKIRGGRTSMRAVSSQYLTSLLINCPLAQGDTEIILSELNERPYIEMTLAWLRRQGIACEHDDELSFFRIPGGQAYRGFDERIAGDFSSATFFLVAAAITGSEVVFDGLDMNDPQGDKAVVQFLEQMGAEVKAEEDRIVLQGGSLHGIGEVDMNATPDALPAMAVAASYAEGTTRLVNVPQARLKETDRISVMCSELTKMGAKVEELTDGLVINGTGTLRGAKVHGHGDHRVVMALAVAGLAADGVTEVDTAESAAVTFPDFLDKMRSLGAGIEQL
ncbi:MAG: 3-phosphoshikimate 1-carboxyvinyltransferase, partial [bacterium]